jgi:hypothetical protein
MAEWSKDHMAAIGSLKLNTLVYWLKIWLKWRPGGATRRKWGQLVGKVRSRYVVSWHLQDCSPRLSRLRTVRLTPTSKYWTYRLHVGDMGTISLVVGCQQELDFSPLLFGCCGREAGYGPADRMTVVLWIVLGALLLGCGGSVQNLLMTVWKVAICGPREIRMVMNHTWTKRGKRVACWSGFPLQGVHRFESPRLSNMSNSLFVAVFSLLT